MESLRCVPDDPTAPYCVDSERIRQTLLSLEYDPEPLSKKPLVSAAAYGVWVGEYFFYVCQTKRNSHLSVRTVWQTHKPYSAVFAKAFAACDAWNRKRTFPTAYLLKNSDGEANIVADFLVDCRRGLSDLQLSDNLQFGLDSGCSAMAFLKEVMGEATPASLSLSEDSPGNV